MSHCTPKCVHGEVEVEVPVLVPEVFPPLVSAFTVPPVPSPLDTPNGSSSISRANLNTNVACLNAVAVGSAYALTFSVG